MSEWIWVIIQIFVKEAQDKIEYARDNRILSD